MNIVGEIKTFVENECKKPTSNYGYDPFVFHFIPVVEHARQLAQKFDVDVELIEIAAWLHDIGSIIYWRKDHHITWAQIAEEKLTELWYPREKIALVKKCIFNHRGSTGHERTSIEEKILAEADVMANFDNIAWLFRAALVNEQLWQQEALDSVRKKIENKWKQLEFPESKKIVQPKYEAAIILLWGNTEQIPL